MNRNFVIFHPSDFSAESEVAFEHALKIALQARAKLDVMHVEAHLRADEPYWLEFPAVRATLARWGVLSEGAGPDDVAKVGLRVRKSLKSGADPVKTMMRHFRRFPPDLIVLATHQREGVERWLHKAVAEPLARKAEAMTLFVPRQGKGFVSKNGTVELKKILIPIDHHPDPETALNKALLLARGLGCTAGEVRLVHVGSTGSAPRIDPPQWPGWSYNVAVRQGNIVDEILKTERDWYPDLMALATQGHLDFLDALRGSTTERVLRGAQCPVLAVPDRYILRS